MQEDQAFECPRCQIGLCQPGKATYTRIARGQLISVPDMPIYTCDVCGYYEYDGEAVYDLEAMMGVVQPLPPDDQRPRVKPTPPQPDTPVKSPRPKP